MKLAPVYAIVLYRKRRERPPWGLILLFHHCLRSVIWKAWIHCRTESLWITAKGMQSAIRIKYLRIGFVFNLTNLLCLKIILSMFCGFLDKNSHMKNNSVFLPLQETLLTCSTFFPPSYFHVKIDVTYIGNLQRNMWSYIKLALYTLTSLTFWWNYWWLLEP